MSINDLAEEEAKLVMDIYEYALSHDMDIEDKNDVTEITKALCQEDMDDEHIERLMTALRITANRIQTDIANRKRVN